MVNLIGMRSVEYPQNALLDVPNLLAPATNALRNYTQGVNAAEQTKYERGRQAVADQRAAAAEGRAETAFKQQQMDRIGETVLAASKLPPGDPRRAKVLSWAISQHPAAAEHAETYQDPVKGLDMLAAEFGKVRDEREERKRDLEMQKLEREAKGVSAAPPHVEEFYDDQGRKSKRQWDPTTRSWVQIGGAAMPAEDTALARAQAASDVKRVSEYTDASDNANKTLSDLQRLEAARSKTTMEGPWLSYLPNLSAASQEVQSTAMDVQLGFTNQTKGAISESENRMFARATPGMDMSDDAARPVIEGQRLALRRTQERAIFFDTWLRSKRTLDGAQAAWTKFVNEKPIVTEGEGGKFVLNPQNVDAWKDYIAPQGRSTQGPAQQPAAPQAKPGEYDWSPDGGLKPRGQ